MQLKELIQGLDAELRDKALLSELNTEIGGIAYDSRKVKPGDVFVCIIGEKTDGHNYIDAAIASGAAAVIAMRGNAFADTAAVTVVYTGNTRAALAHISNVFYGYPSRSLKLIGVTGTNGKTSVTYLLKTILEHAHKKVGLIGTNQNMIGDKVVETSYTTPESLELQQLLREMLQSGVEYVVMEVSSHALEQLRVQGCMFETALFTNLTHDHLDYHRDMESYYRAKCKLFDMCKTAVINIDDEHGKRLASEVKCPNIAFTAEAAGGGADMLCASDIKLSVRGASFMASYGGSTGVMRIGMLGRFSVYNALAAMGAAIQLGFTMDDAQKGLIIAQGVKGRAEMVSINKDYAVIIDYAHTPDGLKNILSSVREFAQGRIVTLFGCGGDRDPSKRAPMGEAAGEWSDFCIVTSDNPRTEVPAAIIAQILPGMEQSGCAYIAIENRREAIRYALEHAQTGDTIVLAGKGHETYQIIGNTKFDFDERDIVRDITRELQ